MADITRWFSPNQKVYPHSPVKTIKGSKALVPESLGGTKAKGTTCAIEHLYDNIEKLASSTDVKCLAYTQSFKEDQILMYNEDYMTREVDKAISKCRNVMKYTMVADWSPTGRFHMHGVIIFNDIVKILSFQKKMISKFGNIKLKTIDNSIKWANYCVQVYKDEGKDGVRVNIKNLRIASNTI
nr:rep protein [Cressdnaviricota sp.]